MNPIKVVKVQRRAMQQQCGNPNSTLFKYLSSLQSFNVTCSSSLLIKSSCSSIPLPFVDVVLQTFFCRLHLLYVQSFNDVHFRDNDDMYMFIEHA